MTRRIDILLAVSCILRGCMTTLPSQAQTPAPGTSFRDCSNCPEMVVVKQGKFTMGAPAGEEETLPEQWRGHAAPRHLVTIRHKFAIGKFDVTRDEYAQFVAET